MLTLFDQAVVEEIDGSSISGRTSVTIRLWGTTVSEFRRTTASYPAVFARSNERFMFRGIPRLRGVR